MVGHGRWLTQAPKPDRLVTRTACASSCKVLSMVLVSRLQLPQAQHLLDLLHELQGGRHTALQIDRPCDHMKDASSLAYTHAPGSAPQHNYGHIVTAGRGRWLPVRFGTDRWA
jgi:hypothetical protein